MILVTLMVPVFLLPLVGLAIDGSILFLVQAKLASAADGAVLGAGRLLNTSANTSEIAGEFLNVNFPNGYWGSHGLVSNITATDVSGLHTISLTANVQVPLLFMRVIGQNSSIISVSAQASKRDVRMMIVVDRSGSVVREGANTTIVNVLNQWVASSSSSLFKDGQDNIGMVSFGGTWNLDFSPTIYFQSSTPNIGTAINKIGFTDTSGNSLNSGTNTAEGLYQAWYQLRKLNDPTALNVILLLTDGRPSAFTGVFTSTANCTSTSHTGVLQSQVGVGSAYPYWPPPLTNPYGGNYVILGIQNQQYQGNSQAEYYYDNTTSPNGCKYTTGISSGGETNQNAVPLDIPTFPALAGPVDNVGTISAYTSAGVSTQTGYYNLGSLGLPSSTTNTRAVRYASFNVADNIATLIRQDTVIKPVLFVIGLHYPTPPACGSVCTEPLDNDWLARLANDPSYVIANSDSDAGTTVGGSVYQTGQTAGWYYESNAANLGSAFANISSQILRLSQ
jgi:Flp pilus assembly protein TadG